MSRAWVIKTDKGYASGDIDDVKLNEALLYSSKGSADSDSKVGETVVPVEITLIKRNKK